jgi:hypothetical protein
VAPRPDELRFDEAAHRYFLGDQELPSVTRIINSVFPFNGQYADARDRGTAVHLACQYDDEGRLDESTVYPEYWNYLTAWRAFRESSGFVPEEIEIRKYHQFLKYAGTIDRIGRLSSGRRIVIDLKTGGKYPQYRIQLAAYVNLLGNPFDFHRGSVTLEADGSFSFDEFPLLSTQEGANDLAVFRSCFNIHNFNCLQKLL